TAGRFSTLPKHPLSQALVDASKSRHSPVGLQGRPPWASVRAGRIIVSPPRPTPPAHPHLRDYSTRLIFQVPPLWETAAATGAVGLPTRRSQVQKADGGSPADGGVERSWRWASLPGVQPAGEANTLPEKGDRVLARNAATA